MTLVDEFGEIESLFFFVFQVCYCTAFSVQLSCVKEIAL